MPRGRLSSSQSIRGYLVQDGSLGSDEMEQIESHVEF